MKRAIDTHRRENELVSLQEPTQQAFRTVSLDCVAAGRTDVVTVGYHCSCHQYVEGNRCSYTANTETPKLSEHRYRPWKTVTWPFSFRGVGRFLRVGSRDHCNHQHRIENLLARSFAEDSTHNQERVSASVSPEKNVMQDADTALILTTCPGC